MTLAAAPPFPIASHPQPDETSPSSKLLELLTDMLYQSAPAVLATVNPNQGVVPSVAGIEGTAALSNTVRLVGPAAQPTPSAPLEIASRSLPVSSETIASRGCHGGPSRPGPRWVLTVQPAG